MSATRRFLPYARQHIEDDDIEAVSAVLRSDWLTTGPAVGTFEEAFADTVGARYAIACSSGTAALHLATMALGLGPRDYVIVPTISFLASANAVRYTGAEVAFADVDPETGQMDGQSLRVALGHAAHNGVKAVISVYYAGQCQDPEQIAEVAAERDLKVVEDASHALGSTYTTSRGVKVRVGSCQHSDMATFSLHPTKTITMGEGGVVTTNERRLRDRLCELRSHGQYRDAARFDNQKLAHSPTGQANPWYYEMAELGYNYRASDIHCALGLGQLTKVDRFVAQRRKIAAAYDSLLAPLSPFVQPLRRTERCDPAWHLYVVLVDFESLGLERAELMRLLQEADIGSQVHYIPLHFQPYYWRRYGKMNFDGAEKFYDKALSLPMFPDLTSADVERVVAAIASCVRTKATNIASVSRAIS